ncbi:hypothetical protein TWF506_008478 [Arthrobotrys conoides]|uniref:Uncharacterized protein n=1 Tax=Arthrobotrys conoides TaxID=74498 RepID=A0AAN8NEL2_9PEZI
MASSSIRALTCKLPLRKYQSLLLLPSIRLFATVSQPAPQPASDNPPGPPPGPPPRKKPRPKKNAKTVISTKQEQRGDGGTITRGPRITKLPNRGSRWESKAPYKNQSADPPAEQLPGEDEDWSLAIDEVVGGFPGDDPWPQPLETKIQSQEAKPKPRSEGKEPKPREKKVQPKWKNPQLQETELQAKEAELQSQEPETKDSDLKEKPKDKKKKKKKKKQQDDEESTKVEEKAAVLNQAEDSVKNEVAESHHSNNLAPISSILDFGLSNRIEKDPLVASVNDSILGKEPQNRDHDDNRGKRILEDVEELSLDDLFQRFESSIETKHFPSNRKIVPESQDDKVVKAATKRREKHKKLDEVWEHYEQNPVSRSPKEGEGDNQLIEPKKDKAAKEEDTTITKREDVTTEAERQTEEKVDETPEKGITAEHLTNWLDRLEIRRAEQRKKWEEARSQEETLVKEESRPKEELDAWSSEGRELNTSIIFTQSVQDPAEVDLVWYNQDNYRPTRSYTRPSSSEHETVLGRRIGDPNQLLSALSNGRNEYHYSLENLRLMRQGMEVAGLHERLRRTKLPFQFPAIKYEDIENIFRPKLPVGAQTAYDPFPIIVPQESAVEIPFLWRVIEENSKYLAIYGDVKSCQGYHPSPSQYFNNFVLNFYGYLRPTSIMTDANYRQPYSRQQTILSFMGIPTMVILTVPNQSNSEPIVTRNLLAQLIAETFSCHYYNREIMQAQAPIIGLLHHDARLWVVLYDPVADIPYVSRAINADLDIPPSHDIPKPLRYLSLFVSDAFTCAAINGIEAMRHRERREGETDGVSDWLEASTGMWDALEARRMTYIQNPSEDIPVKAYLKMIKNMDRARQGSLAALQSIPPQYRISIGESVDRWWMKTTRPTWQDLTESLPKPKSHKKPANQSYQNGGDRPSKEPVYQKYQNEDGRPSREPGNRKYQSRDDRPSKEPVNRKYQNQEGRPSKKPDNKITEKPNVGEYEYLMRKPKRF